MGNTVLDRRDSTINEHGREFYEIGPIYLSELIKKHNSSNRTRRANDHCLLSILPISKMCANSYFERSFS